jgi:phosphoglycolate/pyridoxal phosphate phosphatase family enzyme
MSTFVDRAICGFSAMSTVYVFDLDGVLYRGESAVPGAAEALSALRARGAALFFLTNNSSQPRQVYVEKLTRLGMSCTVAEVVTSASATADYLARVRGAVGKTVFAVGGPGIKDELERVGIGVRTVSDPEAGDATCAFVVAGLDREFRYETLRRAQQVLLGGAQFIATNRDGQYPVESGVIPGGGSVVAAISVAAGIEPLTIGKPETLGLETILNRAGVWPTEAVMIGDRLDTDILCGNRLGVPTVLVLTGVTTRAQAESAEGDLKPTRIIETLAEL